MSNNDELIAQFTEITGTTIEVARFYLESSNWALQDALSTYLGHQAETDEGNDEIMGDDDDAVLMPTNSNKTSSQQTGEPTTPADATKKYTASKIGKPKIATLHNMSQRSSSDEEGQAFYAGGSERSGQQVLGPPKRKNFREKLTDMFRLAHEQTQDQPTPSTSSGVNWGVGLRLGQTENDHSVVGAAAKPNSRKPGSVILKLWSQGFSINDGELRLYDDPENNEFLETVMRGEIPSELMEMGSMVSVDVEDHREEDFKRKVKKVQTFKGPGQTLGSPAPNVIESSSQESTTSTTNNEENEKVATERLNVNAGEGVTQLQIRLADGSRITSQFNLTHTVGDIRQFIQTARPLYANRTFTLVSSFPTREIDDDTATIEKAGLKNAAIMQRLK